MRGWSVGRSESRVIFTSGSAVEEQEEESLATSAACAVSLPSCDVTDDGHSKPSCSSDIVLPCSSAVGTSIASGICDSLGQY